MSGFRRFFCSILDMRGFPHKTPEQVRVKCIGLLEPENKENCAILSFKWEFLVKGAWQSHLSFIILFWIHLAPS
jgi:hypothetical protein